MSKESHHENAPATCRGCVRFYCRGGKNYFFLALALTAALGADLVVFFETGFFADAIM
jgi:hypothetical protein